MRKSKNIKSPYALLAKAERKYQKKKASAAIEMILRMNRTFFMGKKLLLNKDARLLLSFFDEESKAP